MNRDTRAVMRGTMLACFAINLFLFLVVFENWGGGYVPTHLPFLVLGSMVMCLIGWYQNRDKLEDDDDDS